MHERGKERKGNKKKIKPSQKIYIFCEGKTETIYLQHFENRKYNIEIVSIPTEHTDAKGIVEYAKSYFQREKIDLKLGDRGYCVFDSDPKSNTDINTVFNLLEGYKHKGLYYIFSNPCFEVWFVLHYRNAPYGKKASEMKSEIKRLLNDANYSETKDIYDILLPRQQDALNRSKLLHKEQKKVHKRVCSHECNPYTNIFEFFEYMEDIIKSKQNTD